MSDTTKPDEATCTHCGKRGETHPPDTLCTECEELENERLMYETIMGGPCWRVRMHIEASK